jgi:NADH-quinone oxidoreductase subunit A
MLSEYYRNYLAVFVLICAASALVYGILALGKVLRPVSPNKNKLLNYESGSDPSPYFGQVNIRYYVFAILFVVFDVEALFVIPWAMDVNGYAVAGYLAISSFMIILLIGLFYDYRKGHLSWD